jgi:hypothetical protein
MVTRMNRIENAARLAMADLGTEVAPMVHPGMTFATKLGLVLVSLTLTGLIAVSLF